MQIWYLYMLTVFVVDVRVPCVGYKISYEYKSASQLLKQFQLGWLVHIH